MRNKDSGTEYNMETCPKATLEMFPLKLLNE
jgi:hypothetical protein